MRRKLIDYFLMKRGLAIGPLNGPTLRAALRRLSARHIPLETIIDVGASNGCWTEELLPFYPQARYLCVEAQPVHKQALDAFVLKHGNVEYVLAAAGDRKGKLFFEASDPFGGVASEAPFETNCIVVPVTTLDMEVQSRKLKPPYLIKLDTHGFEVPILDGASRTLESTAVLIIEVYNFDIAPGALRFPAMCQYLETRGFRCIDVFDPMFRPGDGAFWQADMVFVSSDRPEFRLNSYSGDRI
ncbi:MAG TPA: FkbM family methyltransferase [Terriglobia bacterium]|nr:FkbM family methyltransferase [Terriglobia bacterium]